MTEIIKNDPVLDLARQSLDNPVSLVSAPEPVSRHSTLALHTVADITTEAELHEAITHIEPRSRLDPDSTFERAIELEHLAGRMGLDRHRLRAQLVAADVQMRRGQGASGALTAESIRNWAQANDDSYLLARSHRVLAQFYWRLGDQAVALECVVHGVRLLEETDDPTVIAEHRTALADALLTTGSFDAAKAEYEAAIQLCEELGNVELQLAALNNYAYACSRQDELQEALAVANTMITLSAQHAQPMHITWSDTIGRIRLGMGQYQECLDLLEPIVAHPELYEQEQLLGLAECFLTCAEAHRHLDQCAQAQEKLTTCEKLVTTGQLELLRVGLLREQATMAAKVGDFETAYTRQRAAFDLAIDLRSDERDARARTLMVLHQTSTAQADRARFRRLSLLDPLTGLGNRRFVNETLDRVLQCAQSDGTHVAIGLFDLDHFKRINDTWSHSVGDQVLQEISAILAKAAGMTVRPGQSVRELDAPWDIDIEGPLADPRVGYAARIGGEEFLLVIPGVTAVDAPDLMAEVLATVRETQWHAHLPVDHITGSIGLVLTDGQANASELMRSADELLYLAKAQGRDQVVGPERAH